MTIFYEILEYIKKIFVTVFGAYHVEEGNKFLTAIDISLFDRIIFIGIALALIFTIWTPKLIRTNKKRNKLIAEVIIHIVILGMIVYETLLHDTWVKGAMLTLLYVLFELSIGLFLTKPNAEKNEVLTVKEESK